MIASTHVRLSLIRPVDVRGELRPNRSSAATPTPTASSAAVCGGVQSDPRDWDAGQPEYGFGRGPGELQSSRPIASWPLRVNFRNPHDWQPGEVPVKIVVDNFRIEA